jgi:hypothetical protein
MQLHNSNSAIANGKSRSQHHQLEARGLSAGTTSTLTMVNNIGSLCKDEGKLKEAEQALKGKEKAWGLLKVAIEGHRKMLESPHWKIKGHAAVTD